MCALFLEFIENKTKKKREKQRVGGDEWVEERGVEDFKFYQRDKEIKR